jgi:hypothetical protein
MPEWLDRALFGILAALAVLFVWGCIAGVMGAPAMLIWIGGIGVTAGIVSWTEEASNPSGGSLSEQAHRVSLRDLVLGGKQLHQPQG